MNGKTTKGTPVAPAAATAEPNRIDKANLTTWGQRIFWAVVIILFTALAFMWINNMFGVIRISAF